MKPDSAIDSQEGSSRRDCSRSLTDPDQQKTFKGPSFLKRATIHASQEKRHSPLPLLAEDADLSPENAAEHQGESLPRIPVAVAPRERSFLNSSALASSSLQKRLTCTTAETGASPARSQHRLAREQTLEGSWPPSAPSAVNSVPKVPRPARRIISFKAPTSHPAGYPPEQQPLSAPTPKISRHLSSAKATEHSTPQGPMSSQDSSLLGARQGTAAGSSEVQDRVRSQDRAHTASAEHNLKTSAEAPCAVPRSAANVPGKAGLKRAGDTSCGAEGPRAGKQSRSSSSEGHHATARSEAAVMRQGPPEVASQGLAGKPTEAPEAALQQSDDAECKNTVQEASEKPPPGFRLKDKAPGLEARPTAGAPASHAPPLPPHASAANAHLQRLRAALELSRCQKLEKKVLSARSGGENTGGTPQPAQAKGEGSMALAQPQSSDHKAEHEAQEEARGSKTKSNKDQKGQENRQEEVTQSPRRRTAEKASSRGTEDSKSSRPGEAIRKGSEGAKRGRDDERKADSVRSAERTDSRYEDNAREISRHERYSCSSRHEGRSGSRHDEDRFRRSRHSNEMYSRREDERYRGNRHDVDRERSDRRGEEGHGRSRRSEERHSSRRESEERRDGGVQRRDEMVQEKEKASREKAEAVEMGMEQEVATAAATAAKLAAVHKAVASIFARVGTAQPVVSGAFREAQGVQMPADCNEPEAAGAGEKEIAFKWQPQASTGMAGSSSSRSLSSIRAAAAKTAAILNSVKLPNFVKQLAGGPINPEVQALNVRLKEVNALLQAGSVGCSTSVLGGTEPPSPPPVYNSAGVRTNTRENLAKEALCRERREIIAELLKKDPTYKAPADYRPPKLYRKIPVPVDDFPNFNFIGFILGPRGSNQKRMEKESGAKIYLRGKQMQRGGAPPEKVPWEFDGVESSNDEPLHVLIEARTEDSLETAARLIQKQLATSPEALRMLQDAQFQELAVINGTSRQSATCFLCGKTGHIQFNCPQSVPSFQAGVKCLICSDGSHPTSDCPKASRSGAGSSAELVDTLGEVQEAFEYKCFLEEIGAGHPGLGAYFHAMGEAGKGQGLFSGNGAIQSSLTGGPVDAERAAGGAAEGGSCSTASGTADGDAVRSAGGAPVGHGTAVASAPADANPPAAASSYDRSGNVAGFTGVAEGVAKFLPPECKLYVGHLPWSVDSQQLRALFAPFGELKEATVVSDRLTGKSKGFGFVRYKCKEAASHAVRSMNKFRIGNCVLIVRAKFEDAAYPQQQPQKQPPQQQRQQPQKVVQGLSGGMTGPGLYWGAENGVQTAYSQVSAPPVYQPYSEQGAAYMADAATGQYCYAEGDPSAVASHQGYYAYAQAGYDVNQMYYQPALDEYGNPVVYMEDGSGVEEREVPPGMESDQDSEGPPGVDREGPSEDESHGAPAGYPQGFTGDTSVYGAYAGGAGGFPEYAGHPSGPYYYGADTADAAALTAPGPAPALPSLLASLPADDELPPGENPSHWMAAEATAAEAAASEAAAADAPAPSLPPPEPSAELPLIPMIADSNPAADGVCGAGYTPFELCQEECVATAEDGPVVEDDAAEDDYIIKGELPLGVLPGYSGPAEVQAEP